MKFIEVSKLLGALNKVDMFLKLCQYVKDLLNIWYVPNQFKTQEMWNREVQSDPWMFEYVPDQHKAQEMCNEAVKKSPEVLSFVADQYKTQEMCNEAVQSDP